jgi:glycosyltransferase involved in cell wall biosynthesis
LIRVAVSGWFWDRPATGSGQYTRRLVEELAAPGSGVEAVVVRPGTRRSNLSKVWFEQVTFPQSCRRTGARVAHVPYWAPPLRPAVPTVVTIHDLIPLLLPDYRGGPLVRLYTGLASAASSRAALILTDSTASREDVVDRLAVAESKVRTVYLAAGPEYSPAAGPDDPAVRQRYRLPERYLLYLGGFDVRKNVSTLLAAYARAVRDLGNACPLVVCGRLPAKDSSFEPDPRRVAGELGLGGASIHFTGFVEEKDKPALYRGAAALVFPSRYEGFGLPPLEAMACGTPVVSSCAASLPEIVGEGGLLVKPDDVAGIAQALVRLARDGAYRAELSRRALEQAGRFSWRSTARQTIEAYQEAARR